MIQEAHNFYQTYKITIGQYVAIKRVFVSDKMLSGEVIRFNPGVYSDFLPVNVNTAFQLLYSATPGTYEMDIVNCKNHKAFLKVIDAYNFEIEYRFFASKNYFGWFPDISYSNTNAFNGNPFSGKLGFYVQAGGEVKSGKSEVVASVDIILNAFCTGEEISFDDDGYIPGEDLEVNIETAGNISNNFFVGLIKEDSISNDANIVPGLVLNYAKVGSTISQVCDLPYTCFNAGKGFIEQNSINKATVTIDGSCLQSNSVYKIYIVYYQDGQWKSCISNGIKQASQKPAIIPSVTILASDTFGNTSAKSCIKGLANGSIIDLCVTVDVVDFDAKLVAAGLTGTFTDYLEEAKAFKGGSISSSTGIPLLLTDTHPTYCIDEFSSENSSEFVIIQFVLNYAGYKDIINIPFELVYDAVINNIEIEVFDTDGVVGELCDGGDYIMVEDFTDCEIQQSVEGSLYYDTNIITGTNIDETQMPTDSEVCIRAICALGTTQLDGCIEDIVEYCLSVWGFGSLGSEYIHGTIWSIEYEIDGVVYQEKGEFLTFEIIEIVCATSPINIIEFLYSVEGEEGDADYGIDQTIIPCVGPDCCPDADPECNNYAAIDFDCDPDTQTINITLVKTLESTIDTESFLCSVDGGATFIPCPASVVGETNVFVTYDASFTDICENLHVEQAITCVKTVSCSNSRDIDLSVVTDTLVITLTDTFSSAILLDKLFVSLDGGLNYDEYNPSSSYAPVALDGDESIVVYSETIFDDECNDLIVTETMDLLSETNPPGTCGGYGAYTLTPNLDDITGEITLAKTGTEADLVVNELLWTLDGTNPFDVNGSGMPYYGAVIGYGLFIARWRIKLPNCDETFIDTMIWVKECVDICTMPIVQVSNNRYWEEFVVTVALENNFVVTKFTVPDKSIISEADINADFIVTRGGVIMTFVNTSDPSTLDRYEYTFDLATNKFLISTTIQIYEGEIFIIRYNA